MSEQTLILLNLINEGHTLNEICELMKLSHKQVYNLFRMIYPLGYEFDRAYYSNGDIKYKISEIGSDKKTSIITDPSEQSIKIMVLSDLHLGCDRENIKAINMIYDYLIKNDIHLVINAGDFVDGINIGSKDHKYHNNGYDQIKYADKNYPFDKSILNFLVLGNHDIDLHDSFGINLINYFNNFRHDIVPLGYGQGIINIKNSKLEITHKIDSIKLSGRQEYIPISLKGHTHIYRTKVDGCNQSFIYVPTLSNLYVRGFNYAPQAVLMEIGFSYGNVCFAKYTQLLVEDKISVISTMEHSINLVKGCTMNESNNEENYKRKVLKT